MLKAIAFGICTGAGIQAWRHWPSDGPVTSSGAYFVLLLAVVSAYLGGRWHGRGAPAFASASAHARATATAQATQSVQVAVVVPGSGAAAMGSRIPNESVEWFGGSRFELQDDQFDGMDISELVEREAEPEGRA